MLSFYIDTGNYEFIEYTRYNGYTKPDRPAIGEKRETKSWYKAEVNIFEEPVNINKYKEKARLFILATNELEHEKISDIEVLIEYKEQSAHYTL